MWKAKQAAVTAIAASCLLFLPVISGLSLPSLYAQETGNRYAVAGITDPDQFEAFYAKLQKWVNRENKAAVARNVQYPLRVNKDGQSRFVTDEKQFIAEYEEIMTERVRLALEHQPASETFVNYQGVMVGSGEIWLRQSQGKFYIVAINP
ncbi:hypothetical protein [Brevibacillus brevis]|uniref:Uncharacterized protein n=1 Tax=Brevibacillus brevis TaxID=1393 RepID=A0ABY9TEB0_BREBE|nr:hypothetical protein [Brevibacillus brevis]WNC16963.1 hypothetical protein RGB73_11840 [Brevibacillus brevis]